MARNPNLIMAWSWRGIYLRPKEVKYKICYDLSWKATNSKHLYWDIISKIAQDSACDTFPGSRSYLMKRFNLFFGDVLRDWLLKQGVWLTIFFYLKQLLVKSLHDQDHIWWKVSNSSSETFLERVDLSKIVNLAWTYKIYWSSGMNWPWMARNGLNLIYIGIIFQRMLRILLVIRFQDQDPTWWKDFYLFFGDVFRDW